MKNYAIILASGSGHRAGTDLPKQFLKIAGKTVLEHTIDVFEKNKNIHKIIIVSNANYIDLSKEIILKNNYLKIDKIITGGESRRESSFIGISSIEDENAKILIHDAVRPFLSNRIINECLDALEKYDAVDVAIKATDTIIKINAENFIEEIPERKFLYRGQTPQAFDLKLIKQAHELANQNANINVTDDCGLIAQLKLAPIYVIEGDESNLKITHPLDVAIADKLFQLKSINPPKINLNQIENKVLVVFGASKGIGASIVELARKHKAIVYGFSRRNGTDITKINDIRKALKSVYDKEKRIDFVVNTAGLLKMGKINCRNTKSIKEEININYMGNIYIAQESYKYLRQSQGSMLTYTSSSYTRGRALYSIYSSTKSALVNLVQALAEEWNEDKIRINIINPERTATPMRFSNFGKEPKNTLLTPEAVAKISLQTLISDCTGQVADVRNSNF